MAKIQEELKAKQVAKDLAAKKRGDHPLIAPRASLNRVFA